MKTAAALPTNPPLNLEVDAHVNAVMLSPRKQALSEVIPNCSKPCIPIIAAINSAVFWNEASDSKCKLGTDSGKCLFARRQHYSLDMGIDFEIQRGISW